MSEEFHSPKRTWRRKFRDAFRGIYLGMRDQSSFHVHGLVASVVIAAGILLRVNMVEWALLALSIAGVLSAEMMNTAVENLAKAVDRNHNQHIGNALDIGSAAVLIAAFGAATVGMLVLGHKLWSIVISQS